MSAFTPGPWHFVPLTKSFGVYDSSGTAVAKVGGAFGISLDRRNADARLIAAAPELLCELRRMTDWVGATAELLATVPRPNQSGLASRYLLDAIEGGRALARAGSSARAAIAKATGVA